MKSYEWLLIFVATDELKGQQGPSRHMHRAKQPLVHESRCQVHRARTLVYSSLQRENKQLFCQ